jgi:uncharacterized protein YdeI (YjbR/CyaY-like superfamily)
MAAPKERGELAERVYVPDRVAWRAWLAEHHATASGVWLVYYKKESGKPRVAYDEAVEEALCFGWIDSRSNAIDGERYAQLFTPRRAGSPWSRPNKQRVAELTRRGLMAPAGLAAIERARRDGSWVAYDEVEDLRIPADLEEALAANATAAACFAAFGASSKKQILWWIASAKRPETRRKRVEQMVAAAERNENPLAYRAKKEPPASPAP